MSVQPKKSRLMDSSFRWGLFVLLLSLILNPAEAHEGQMVRGTNFEGMVANPAMLADFSHCEGSIFSTGLWTPSPTMVRQAESRLQHAIAQRTVSPKVLNTYYVPQYYTPKCGTPLATPGQERLETDIADSDQDNFLYKVRPILSEYKRQYLGVTFKGKKYLYMSFIHSSVISGDSYAKKNWGHRWVEALDGGDLFWEVLYDPISGTFSEWECNGYA
jgi:hypothetical protein